MNRDTLVRWFNQWWFAVLVACLLGFVQARLLQAHLLMAFAAAAVVGLAVGVAGRLWRRKISSDRAAK
jgi:FtsH-binding integral membrane protein